MRYHPHDIHKIQTKLLKFIARYPYYELIDKDDPDNVLQIMAVHYGSQEVILRDFCDYTLPEIVAGFRFKDNRVNKLWKALVIEYCEIALTNHE